MIKIAIIGRPNVGKSSLFNRLSIRKKTIVYDFPGVTRDVIESKARIGDLEFIIIDTPGIDDTKNVITENMIKNFMSASEKADIVLFMYDNTIGVTPADQFLATKIRKLGKKVFVIANKSEGKNSLDPKSYNLGFGNPIMISALHGYGIGQIYDIISKIKIDRQEEEKKAIKISFVGRPNVGKSSIINSILGEERLLTGPERGITRDSTENYFEYKNQNFCLVDSAGMRKKNKIDTKLERISVSHSIESIKMTDIAILVLDATCALEQQDLKILSVINTESRGLIVVINKWDLVKEKQKYKRSFEDELRQHTDCDIVYVSAIEGLGIESILDSTIILYQRFTKKITTSMLNQWLAFATSKHKCQLIEGRKLKLKYITQISIKPPTFKVFGNLDVPENYHKYLLQSARKYLELQGTNARFVFTQSKNPYIKK